MLPKLLKGFVLFVLILSSQLAVAQKKGQALIDSLIQKIPVKADTNKVIAYNKIAFEYVRLQKLDEALKYSTLTVNLGTKLNYKRGILFGTVNLANTQQVKNPALAEDYYRKALAMAQEQKLVEVENKLYYYLSYVSLLQFKNEASQQFAKKSLTYFEKNYNKEIVDNLKSWLASIETMEGNPKNQLNISLENLKKFSKSDASDEHLYTLYNVSKSYLLLNDIPKALDYLQDALNLRGVKNPKILSQINYLMANLYRAIGDYKTALDYGLAALKNFEQDKNKESNAVFVFTVMNSASSDYLKLGDYKKALAYHDESLKFLNDITDISQIKVYRVNAWYQQAELAYYKKNYSEALKYINLALSSDKQMVEIFKPWINPLMAKVYYNATDNVLLSAGLNPAEKNQKAINLLLESVRSPKLNFTLVELRDNYLDLNILYEREKDFNSAYDAYKKYTFYRDSLISMSKNNEFVRKEARFTYSKKEDSLKYVQQLMSANLMQQTLLAKQNSQELLLNQSLLNIANKEKDLQRFAYLKSQAELQSELSLRKANQKQLALVNKEKDLQRTEVLLQRLELKARKNQSLYFMLGLGGLTLLSFVIGRNYIVQRRSNKVIVTEKQRSDDLLLNILPADIAEELKEKGMADARLFDEVTVIFTDFVNFTKVTESLSPQDLVQELHYCFKAFDDIITKYGIEKIKTIGDAYLAVSGLPKTHHKHAHHAVLAAQEIRDFVDKRRKEFPNRTFDIRIGLHSGSVVAGIVGVKKFAFDIWGDAVNTAARMEQSSEAGKINISETTYQFVSQNFTCTYRGEIDAKNKGKLKMYFVE